MLELCNLQSFTRSSLFSLRLIVRSFACVMQAEVCKKLLYSSARSLKSVNNALNACCDVTVIVMYVFNGI